MFSVYELVSRRTQRFVLSVTQWYSKTFFGLLLRLNDMETGYPYLEALWAGGEVSLLIAPPCPTIYIILWVSVRDFGLCFPEDVSAFGVLWIRAPTALGKHPQFCFSTPMFQIRKSNIQLGCYIARGCCSCPRHEPKRALASEKGQIAKLRGSQPSKP